MIELDSLKFTVDTSDLVTAVTKVQALQTAVTNLNKPLAENAKISAKVAAENAKVAVAEEKVAQAKNKTAESQARVEAAQNRAAKASERVTASAKQQTTVLEKNQSIYEFMLQGYSKGQATTLAAAKAQGALAEELLQVGKVLQDQRKLMGGDPFDKSMQGLLSLKNALVDMDAENRMVNQGIQLTSKQYKELSRDLQRITETSIATGESFETMTARLNNHKKQFVEVATEINKLTEVEKERERNQRLQANAIRAIATEDEKMESILRSLSVAQNEHVTVSEKAARSIANYERNLRLAGVSGEVAAAKLDKFRKSAMMAAQAEEKRKVDMLSRALAPQISDVVVSLGSGMNPMTVLLQQGLQVRDLIGLSGVAVNDLQKAFKSAASDMVSSIKGTAVALGSLLVGGLQDAGRAAVNFGMSITGQAELTKNWRNEMLAMNGLMGETPPIVRKLDIAIKALGVSTAFVFTTMAASLVMLVKGFFDVIKQENDLARALALTGRSLNLSHLEAITLAKSLETLGVNTTDAMKVLTLMAKEGVFTSKEIAKVTKAATDLEKYGSVAIEDTVKSFAKLKDKPVEALIELAKKTEGITAASINAVNELVKQGKAHEATSLAIQLQADVIEVQTNRMKNDLSGLSLFAIELAKGIASVTDEIFNSIFRRTPAADLSKKLQQELEIVGRDSFRGKEIEKQLVSLRRQSESRLVASDLTTQQTAAQTALNSALSRAIGLEDNLKTNVQKRTEEIAKANKDYDLLIKQGLRTERDKAKALAAINEKYKDAKTPKSEAAKEEDRLNKAYIRDIERISDMQNKAKGVIEDLTDAEILLKDIRSSETWAKYGPDRQKKIESDLTELAGIQRQIKAEEELNSIRSKNDQTYRDYLSTIQTSIEGLADSNRSLEEEIELIGLEETAIHNVNKERLKALILKKRNESMPSSAAEVILLEQELALMERQVELLDEKFTKQNFVQMRDGIADAIETGLFEGGKAGSAKLRDIIEAELRKPITVFIKAVVGDILGGGKSGDVEGAFGKLTSGASKLYDLLSGGSGTKIGDMFATKSFELGRWLSDSSNSFMKGAGDWLQANANSIGSFAKAGSNVMAGYSLQKGISNGYKVGNGKVVDIATLVGSYVFGPIAGVVGGLFNRAFGRKLKDTGIEGTFSGDEKFSGSTYQFYKGGWFRSDKTKYSAMDPILQSGLGQAYGGLTSANKSMADYLGIDSSSRLKGFKTSVKFSTNGMNEQQIQKKLEEVLGSVAEKQAKLLLGTYETVTKKGFLGFLGKTEQVWKPSEFVKFGETALEALTRLSGSLKAVNTFLENTNDNLLDFSLVGADMASSLVELFNGVDNFNTVSGNYYQQFFSDQERLAKGNELLSKAFADLNISMPSTVKGYRQLVESQDLTTESGRETFAALLSLSSAFYEIKTASEEAASSMIEEINRLRGVVSTSSINGFEGTKSSFLSAIALAKSGDSAAMASLPGLSQSLETMFMSSAGSLEDVNRFRSWLANSIGSGIPAFASGGFHSGGLRLVGENGPELEMTGPSRIFSNNDTMQMLSSEGVIKAIEVMNSNLDMLRAEVRADVQHNAKTAKLLDRVIPDGDSIKTSAL